jgi:hypothetical protein
VGSNRRYPDLADENRDRIALEQARLGTPISLTTREIRSTGPRTDAPQPVPVLAVVRYRVSFEEPRTVEGEAIAWSHGAVLVKYQEPDGHGDRYVWVYANAVRRRSS